MAVSHLIDADALRTVDLAEVREVVGTRSFERGRAYAAHDQVLSVEWDPDVLALQGVVMGATSYEAVATFSEKDDELVFESGECDCPVGYDCKHVAAMVIVAVADAFANGTGGVGKHGRHPAPRRADAPPPWERSLRGLVDAPSPTADERPLAVELSPEFPSRGGHGQTRLVARLMRPGARGGWVNGSLSWRSLDSWGVHEANLRADHLDLARRLYAIHDVGQRGNQYAYYHPDHHDGRMIDLSRCDTPQLWSLLDQAARLDVRLIHADPELGELRPYGRGEVQIDVRRDGERGALVCPVLRLEDADAGEGERLRPLLFLGASGHGLVCAEGEEEPGAEHPRLRLVRLDRPVPADLQPLVLARTLLAVPADELERFATEFCPALERHAPVVSSDGSFEPPAISPPQLVLRASYGANHSCEVGWEWSYSVGSRTLRVPIDGPAAAFRDRAAERAVLAEAALDEAGATDLGLLDETGRPAPSPASLAGIPTMRLTTEVLPLLRERGVMVEVAGEPADYRDVGDSLQIGVSTAEIAGETDWFDLGVTISVEGRELPFAEVFVALAAGESHLLLADGAHLSLRDPRLRSLRELIVEAQELADAPPESLRISRYQAGLWDELASLGVVTEQADAWKRQVGALLALEEIADRDPPDSFVAELRPYQRQGFAWLATLWDLRLGGILADDMGLGKTLQSLALFCQAREHEPDAGPFLVVAPASVIPNWVSEAARFAPQLAVEPVTDTLRKSGRSIEEVARADVVVTTYNLFRLDAEAYREVEWAGLVLDEAQAVKNHQSKTYKCVRELATPFKLALTGTPMENNLTELWSLLSITAPGLFPHPKRFAEQYARPIEREGDAVRLARLRRRIRPLLMRRSKELVADDLPPKQEQTLEVELHARHRKLYDRRLQRERQKILGLIGDFDRNRFTILRSITLLRQLSIHPALVEEKAERVPCAKLDALVDQLGEVIAGGHRALVFSQFTGFLAKVRERLDKEGIGYCYLDGGTRNRKQSIERFKHGDDPAFLISLKAGGFGLNLAEADYCFLLDPWWNPAVEAQAVDRTHRIGQTRPVNVYRLIAQGTIEEKVAALARRKAELFNGVMDDGDLFAARITAEDIRGLLEERAEETPQEDARLAAAA